MAKNRYTGTLKDANQMILDLTPGNYVLRIELALEIKRFLQNRKDTSKLKILEIGSGEGDQTKYVLSYNPEASLDVLDVSDEMILSSKHILSKFGKRIKFICDDASTYLKKIDFKYDVIFSSWVIHNFTWVEKKAVLKDIYNSLNNGGILVMMDKSYPDDKKVAKRLLELQLSRYRYMDNLPRKDITSHELQDYTEEYRMDESSLSFLKKIGFKDIKILDRVERDILIIARR